MSKKPATEVILGYMGLLKRITIVCAVLAPIFFSYCHTMKSGELKSSSFPGGEGSRVHEQLRLKRWQKHLKLEKTSPYKDLRWRSVGPVIMGGRITDIEVAPNNHSLLYVAAATGGIWKTYDEGATWQPIFEHESSSSIGDMAVGGSRGEILWVGTGEKNSAESTYQGTGIFKSSNGGKTWRNMGLANTYHISRIVVHPQNPNIVYVAVIGHLWTKNDARGIYQTIDGGETWEKILYIDEETGIIDLVLDARNPKTLYAASWQRIRRPWNRTTSGVKSGIYKTTDGGRIWRKINNGFPSSDYVGRIGLCIAPSEPDVVYAVLENCSLRELDKRNKIGMRIVGGEVYRSDDRGEAWKKINNDYLDAYGEIGYYFGEIKVDPKEKNRVFILGVQLLASEDAGKSFKAIDSPEVHYDHHALWIDPYDSLHLIDGNDGGLNISHDGGTTWKKINNLSIGQFYSITVDNENPFNIYGGMQDNGTWYGSSDSIPSQKEAWKNIYGMDGGYVQADPLDKDIVYAEGQFGNIVRVNKETRQVKNIEPKTTKGEAPIRFKYITPFLVSAHDRTAIYLGANRLYMSEDRGDHWTPISPDLTTNPVQGNIPYGCITTISESPIRPGLIYTGTDDGRIHVTKNGGDTWQEIGSELKGKWVSRLEASRFDEGILYASFNAYRDDDLEPYLYRSADYGQTWSSIAQNIPCGPIHVVKEDPRDRNTLYVGTEVAIYITRNGGKDWSPLGSCLPTVPVHDVIIHPTEYKLVIGTHGRGVYVLDAEMAHEYR